MLVMLAPLSLGNTVPNWTVIAFMLVLFATFSGGNGFCGTPANLNELIPPNEVPPAVVALT
jgi:hypothetical protein